MSGLGARAPRPNLRAGLDRDVYQILKKLEDTINDGKPFKNVPHAYEAIKRSNSSLSRQKKRPLEDAIERVMQFRKEELADSEDSEADLEPDPKKPDDDRFLLNRQLTKFWQVEPSREVAGGQSQPDSIPRGKKRRLGEEPSQQHEPAANGSEPAANDEQIANGVAQSPATEKTEKPTKKKTAKSTRFQVEQVSQPQALAGIDELHEKLRQQIRTLLQWPEFYAESHWHRPRGVLLSGPSGTGKKALVRSLAAEYEVPLISLAGCLDDPERMDKSLNDAFDEAMALAPSIIFIEKLEYYMPKPSGSGSTETQRRAATKFLAQMDRAQKNQPSDKPVLAMATTTSLSEVDPWVLGRNLFEKVVPLSIPDAQARLDILRLFTKDIKLAENVNLEQIAHLTHGFVGADLNEVLTRVEERALMRVLADMPPNPSLPAADAPMTEVDGVETLIEDQNDFLPPPSAPPLLHEDFEMVVKEFTPSLRKEGFTSIPNVTWKQVGGLQEVRKQLHMSIIGPIKDPEPYQKFGLVLPAGVLLWGPPGCGKTLVAQAVANDAKASLILINGPELLNKYVGESERAVRELFQRARSSKPCILFFDEMDSLVPKRDNASTDSGARVVNALLTELDGARDRSGIYVIGTTNRPDMIDPAILRPGRLSVRLFIDLPTPDERVDILRAICRTRLARTDEETSEELQLLGRVARDPRCNDFSGADLGGLQVKAAEFALQRWFAKEKTVAEIDEEDWEYALENTQASVQDADEYRKKERKLRGAV
jgi:ribosome biogenesis ATPase